MVPTLTPLTPYLGYEVGHIDVSQPLPPGVQELLRGAMFTRGLLVFRQQSLDEEQQLRFAHVFGRISKQGPVQKNSSDVTYVSNVRTDGAFGDVELAFHSDQIYFAHPMKAIMLYGVEIPESGGDTLFSNSAVVVQRMSAPLRETFARAEVMNRLDYGALKFGASLKGNIPDVVLQARHPAIQLHEMSGQTIHFMSPDTTKEVVGETPERTRELLQELHALVAQEPFVYRHQWKAGDLLVWDNTLLQHARTAFPSDQRRTLRRCAIANDKEPAPQTAAA